MPMSESLRVLMTGDCVGGVFPYCLGLAERFHQQGFKVGLALMGPPPSEDQARMLAACPGLSVYHSAFALEWMNEPWQQVDEAGKWLKGIAGAFRPTVVQVNGYTHASVDFGAPVVVVAHSCVFGWWRAVFGQPAPDRYAEYKKRVIRGLSSAQVVVAPTMAMLRSLAHEYAFTTPALTIPNGVDASGAAPQDKQMLFFAAGRVWDRAKDLVLLAEAAPELPWRVCIAGEGDLPEAFANVEALGMLPQPVVRRWMRLASVFVHPARYEPFGLAVLEAALAGCALVLSDIASLRELWGNDALYFPPGDRRALIRVARRVAEDQVLRQRLAQGARQRASRYNLRACAQAYGEVYAALLRRSNRQATAMAGGWS
jgi:glycosyltransferase involved in cell wall biosynthesis